ncbi:MAG: alpha/beta fold hydrolase [Acidobacteriota bacterium]
MRAILLFVLEGFVMISILGAQVPLEERRAVADSGRLWAPVLMASAATAGELAEAMDIDPSTIVLAVLNGSADASAVSSGLGVIEPLRGDTFAVLSTGVAGAVPEPGTDFGFPGTLDDRVELIVTLDVPSGRGTLAFDFAFLSTEYPEFVLAGFNDYFLVLLGDANGVREIAGTEVDTTEFFPASTSQAAGSGYDLYTEDPDGIDDEFGSVGLPDAGLSNFLQAQAQYESNGQITLYFLIQDFGDGILDSAVAIDNVRVATFEMVDPNPMLLDGVMVSSDRARLAGAARTIRGVATDGVTQALLRMETSEPGEVTFSLVDGQAPEDGGFTVPGSTGHLPSITVTVPGDNRAFAIYQAPAEFDRGTDTDLVEREVTIRATFTPTGGDPVESTLMLVLARPPVVFIHGLWSSAREWKMPLIDDPRFPSDPRFTYPSAGPMSQSILRMREKIINPVREALKSRGYAVTQVDAIGHSMGGLLARIHSTNTVYCDAGNLGQGDFRKILTVDTPHVGSLLALFLALLQLNDPVTAELVEQAFLLVNDQYFIDEGAIFDLAFGSQTIAAVQTSPVPAHALIGVGGSDLLAEIAGPYGDLYRIILFFDSITGAELFDGAQHDAVVRKLSQQGGLPDEATSIFGGGHGLHVGFGGPSSPFPGAPASPLYSDRLAELLDTPVDDPAFAFFPPPSTVVPMAGPSVAARARPSLRVRGNGLVIDSPPAGAMVTPGAPITVTVSPTDGVTVDRVLLIGPTVSMEDDAAPFVFELDLPAELIGEVTFKALGRNGMDEIFESEPVTWIAEPAEALLSLDLRPDQPFLYGGGDSLALEVLGTYTDGVVRDLTSQGMTYLTLDSEIVTIDTAGIVTAVEVGITTVIARSGDVQDSVTVYVRQASPRLFADGFELSTMDIWSSTVP